MRGVSLLLQAEKLFKFRLNLGRSELFLITVVFPKTISLKETAMPCFLFLRLDSLNPYH